MIRTIQNIKSFGVFSGFQWPADLPEFRRFNLLYGWNYSGKTTLSRAFRCFELKEWHEDFSDAKVQLRAENSTIYQVPETYSGPAFRIFNSDFVRDNLSFESGTASPILVLGTEDIAKQTALETKKEKRRELVSNMETSSRKLEEETATIDGSLTRYARDFIKNPLGKPNYDRTYFEPVVTKCKDNPEVYLLTEEDLGQCVSVFRSIEKKPELSPIDASLSSIEQLNRRTKSNLARGVAATSPIPRLQADPSLENWVSEGRQFHEDQRNCQFCSQPLPPDLMEHLKAHFSADYDDLMSELSTLATVIDDAIAEKIGSHHASDFYQELSEPFTEEHGELDKLLGIRKSGLEILRQAVDGKKMQAFTSLECPVVENSTAGIEAAIEAINRIITAHNVRTTEFDKRRDEAFGNLENHYAATFIRDERYNQRLQQIEGLKLAAEKHRSEVDDLDLEISTLEQALSEELKGAERINDLLAACFGRLYLRIDVSSDKRFRILREKAVAKNLSEGEETAIAFAYFITRVQDGQQPLADTIVVVDDPVSSLDANHIFNAYAMIKTQLASCRQLFILTHSFEFYNLIREWALDDERGRKAQSKWKKWRVLLVRRKDDDKAVLEEIPKELLRFKSEYHYLFSTLYKFHQAGVDESGYLLGLPNIVRRFMEAFGGIMIPSSKGLKGKMDRLFSDEVERERVWKFINYYSHNRTITRSLTIPDISECRAVVGACLSAVENWNSVYFQELKAEVTEKNGADLRGRRHEA